MLASLECDRQMAASATTTIDLKQAAAAPVISHAARLSERIEEGSFFMMPIEWGLPSPLTQATRLTRAVSQ